MRSYKIDQYRNATRLCIFSGDCLSEASINDVARSKLLDLIREIKASEDISTTEIVIYANGKEPFTSLTNNEEILSFFKDRTIRTAIDGDKIAFAHDNHPMENATVRHLSMQKITIPSPFPFFPDRTFTQEIFSAANSGSRLDLDLPANRNVRVDFFDTGKNPDLLPAIQAWALPAAELPANGLSERFCHYSDLDEALLNEQNKNGKLSIAATTELGSPSASDSSPASSCASSAAQSPASPSSASKKAPPAYSLGDSACAAANISAPAPSRYQSQPF